MLPGPFPNLRRAEMVRIKVKDPVDCQILEGIDLLLPALSYQSETYTKVQWGNKRVPKRKSFIRGLKSGDFFFTGFLHRIQEYCKNNNIEYKIEDSKELINFLIADHEPHIEGKNLREGKWAYQYDLIQNAVYFQRGIIKAATGSGKTAMMLGFISCYSNASVLFLCNTHTPISQLKLALKDSGLKQRIDVSTIQSFYRKKPKEYINEYDIIIIDECHEGLRSGKSMYAKVLRNSLAPIRLGFTATLPDNDADRMTMEGLLGPVIGELTIQEGIERKVLAKPKVIIKKLPDNNGLRDYRSYQDVYHHGVVANRALNRQIVMDAIEDSKEGPVLILVTEIEHGENIIDMAARIYDREFTFVRGETEKDLREAVRQMMISGDVDIVVATAVFKKGLDVPNLSSVILAFGGKSNSQTVQAIGRGTRNVDGTKEYVIIRDYFNSSSYHLIKHFGHRLCLYMEEGWL